MIVTIEDRMSFRLGLWAIYYKYYQVAFSSFLLLTLWRNDCGLLMPTLCWFVYSLYWAWPTNPIKGLYIQSSLTPFTIVIVTSNPHGKGAAKFKVIVVGAGFSGLEIGRRLNESGLKYVILEKSPGLGGTWYDNRYPGAACDVVSHLYR